MKTQIEHWFKQQDWQIFDFQRKVWQAILDDYSGLLHSSTGSGKTYAIWMGILQRLINDTPPTNGIKVLWITPMRALAQDTARSLQKPLDDLGIDWHIGIRTSDTSASVRKKQLQKLPDVLITTPESLSLLLSMKNSHNLFKHLKNVVVDEWHELMGSKRGVQCELGLSRLNHWHPDLQVFGLSATFGNLEQALQHLCGQKKHKSLKAFKREN